MSKRDNNFMENGINKTAIIKIEGGICSQIGYFALGLYLSDLNYKVKYDFSWFENNGKDMDGIFVRNYDLEKAFPAFKLEAATKEEVNLFSSKYNVLNEFTLFQDKMYICNYPDRASIITPYQDYLKVNFKPIDTNSVDAVYEKIKSSTVCAVHVRRGDLSHYHPAYGEPATVNYFLKTINVVKSWEPSTVYFFFSDECNYVIENIIPKLPADIKYEVINQNGSDKGYLDLWLMSKCSYIIGSKGSMAKFANFLSDESNSLIIPKN